MTNVALRVASTLESRLGRKVTIVSVGIDRAHLSKVVLNDLRIANSPGAVNPYFATVKQVTITGGINSFWGRQISVDRIDIVHRDGELESRSRVLQPRILERVRRVELQLGVEPSHYEPGDAAAGRPATTGAESGRATGSTEEREALKL